MTKPRPFLTLTLAPAPVPATQLLSLEAPGGRMQVVASRDGLLLDVQGDARDEAGFKRTSHGVLAMSLATARAARDLLDRAILQAENAGQGTLLAEVDSRQALLDLKAHSRRQSPPRAAQRKVRA